MKYKLKIPTERFNSVIGSIISCVISESSLPNELKSSNQNSPIVDNGDAKLIKLTVRKCVQKINWINLRKYIAELYDASAQIKVIIMF